MRKFDLNEDPLVNTRIEPGVLTVTFPEQVLATEKYCNLRVGGISLSVYLVDDSIETLTDTYKKVMDNLSKLVEIQFNEVVEKHEKFLDILASKVPHRSEY